MTRAQLFLTDVRRQTTDRARVEQSRFMWRNVSGHYFLSVLGIINGLLPRGVALVVYEDGEPGRDS